MTTPRRRATVLVAAVVALTSAGAAPAKEVSTTICGENRCRKISRAIDVATLPGPVSAPRAGSYYTVSLRMAANGGRDGWKVVYEANQQIVRAADRRARAFLGSRWRRLVPELRAPYANAIRGLEPMRAPPMILQ